MHSVLSLWATPRTASTAFEWMMRMRGDMTCFHEPFGEAWYQGEASLWPRATPDSLRTPGLTFDSVWQSLLSAAAAGPVFTKEFPHYVEHHWTDAFLAHFTHSFLIRDPAKIVSSVCSKWPDVHPREIGIEEQRRLFDRLCEDTGSAPPLMDSDDLLEDPHGIVEAWCLAVGIPFLPDALSWEPGPRDEVSWWDGGSFHENLRNSDGLKPQSRLRADMSGASDHARRIYESVLPHFEHMKAHRLSAKPVTQSNAEGTHRQ